jgi:hypothetical protein
MPELFRNFKINSIGKAGIRKKLLQRRDMAEMQCDRILESVMGGIEKARSLLKYGQVLCGQQ